MAPPKTVLFLAAAFLLQFVEVRSVYTSIDGLISACCTGSGLVNPTFTNNDDGSAVEIMMKDNIHNLVFVKNEDTGEVASIDISCSTEPYVDKTYVLTNEMTVSLESSTLANGVALTSNPKHSKFCNVLSRDYSGTTDYTYSSTSASKASKGKKGKQTSPQPKQTTTTAHLIYPLADQLISELMDDLEPDLTLPVYDCRKDVEGGKKAMWEWNEEAFDPQVFSPGEYKEFGVSPAGVGPFQGFQLSYLANKTLVYDSQPRCDAGLQHIDMSCWGSSGLSCCQSYTLANNYASWFGAQYDMQSVADLNATFSNSFDKAQGYQKVFTENMLSDWGHTSENVDTVNLNLDFFSYDSIVSAIIECNPNPFPAFANSGIEFTRGEEESYLLPSCCDDIFAGEGVECTPNEIADTLSLIGQRSAVVEVWKTAVEYMEDQTINGVAVENVFVTPTQAPTASGTAGTASATLEPSIFVPGLYTPIGGDGSVQYASQNVLFIAAIFFDDLCSADIIVDQIQVESCLEMAIDLSLDDVINRLEVQPIDISYIHGCSAMSNSEFINSIIDPGQASAVEESYSSYKETEYGSCGVGNPGYNGELDTDESILRHCFVYTPRGCSESRLKQEKAECWNVGMVLDAAALSIDGNETVTTDVVNSVMAVMEDLQVAADAAAAAAAEENSGDGGDPCDVDFACDGFGNPIRKRRLNVMEDVEMYLSDFVDPTAVSVALDLFEEYGAYQVMCEYTTSYNSDVECLAVEDFLVQKLSEVDATNILASVDSFTTWLEGFISSEGLDDDGPMEPKAYKNAQSKIHGEDEAKALAEIEKIFVSSGGVLPTEAPTETPTPAPTQRPTGPLTFAPTLRSTVPTGSDTRSPSLWDGLDPSSFTFAPSGDDGSTPTPTPPTPTSNDGGGSFGGTPGTPTAPSPTAPSPTPGRVPVTSPGRVPRPSSAAVEISVVVAASSILVAGLAIFATRRMKRNKLLKKREKNNRRGGVEYGRDYDQDYGQDPMEELDVVVNDADMMDSASASDYYDERDVSPDSFGTERIDCESQYTATERRAMFLNSSGGW
ncbi:hypothetical protein TrVE_jg11267 [Triparma verrucosa]|uniref:Uncharacterized protein n=1 Tax=Triparma verrucosa TaxID=1606542 RepID=A0A9W7FK60_9STRA|nr:hypothetical protein TrVE_jg11267 [Triparma verrucosa]